jgi:hypothetical protein
MVIGVHEWMVDFRDQEAKKEEANVERRRAWKAEDVEKAKVTSRKKKQSNENVAPPSHHQQKDESALTQPLPVEEKFPLAVVPFNNPSLKKSKSKATKMIDDTTSLPVGAQYVYVDRDEDAKRYRQTLDTWVAFVHPALFYFYQAPQKDPRKEFLDVYLYKETKAAPTYQMLTTADELIPYASYVSPKTEGEKPPFRYFPLTFTEVCRMWKCICQEYQRLCATVLPHRPVHVYGDLDADTKHTGFEEIVGRHDEVIAAWMTLVPIFWLLTLGRTMNLDIVQWETSCRPGKFSLHVHVPSDSFVNVQHQRVFWKRFIAWLLENHRDSILLKVDSKVFIDVSVYSNKRNFRMVGQNNCKSNSTLLPYDHVNKRIVPFNKITPQHLFNGLISHALACKDPPAAIPEMIADEKEKQGKKGVKCKADVIGQNGKLFVDCPRQNEVDHAVESYGIFPPQPGMDEETGFLRPRRQDDRVCFNKNENGVDRVHGTSLPKLQYRRNHSLWLGCHSLQCADVPMKCILEALVIDDTNVGETDMEDAEVIPDKKRKIDQIIVEEEDEETTPVKKKKVGKVLDVTSEMVSFLDKGRAAKANDVVYMIKSAGGDVAIAHQFLKQADDYDGVVVDAMWTETHVKVKVDRGPLYTALKDDKVADWRIVNWKRAVKLVNHVDVEAPDAEAPVQTKIQLPAELQDRIPFAIYMEQHRNYVNSKASYNEWFMAVMNDVDRYCATIDPSDSSEYLLMRRVYHDPYLKVSAPYYRAMNFQSFENRYQQFRVTPFKKKYDLSIAQLYTKWEKKRVFEAEGMQNNTVAGQYFNTFSHLPITAEIAKARSVGQSCQPLLDFIKDHICCGVHGLNEWLLDFMADVVQNSLERRRNQCTMQGEEGTGKGLLWNDNIGKIFGIFAFHATDSDAVTGKFNSLLDDKLLVVLDELLFGGDKKTAQKMKTLFTEPTRISNTKYGAQRITENNIIPVSLSNEDNIHYTGNSSRRHTIIKPDNWLCSQPKSVKRSLAKDHVFSFAHFLYTRDLSKFDRDQMYQTEGLNEQKKLSMSDVHSWWLAMLDDGLNFGLNVTVVKKRDIYSLFQMLNPGTRFKEISFWMSMNKIMPFSEQDRRIDFTGEFSLDNCRIAFNTHYRGTMAKRDKEDLARDAVAAQKKEKAEEVAAAAKKKEETEEVAAAVEEREVAREEEEDTVMA